MKINTDPQKIEEILNRSVQNIYPTKETLGELLSSGQQLRIFMGIDATADYVHLGHSTNYLILERLHQLGHKIIVLVGDFTAMIGDPSDKTSARTQLSREDVLTNLQSYKEQIGKILNFEDKENPIEFRFNSEWLTKLDFAKLIDLASNFTVQQMLERDMFEKRLEENKPLYVQEFFYPLMQGYDSVELNVDLEIGGNDQTFNMLAGRILAKRYLNKEKCVMTTTLLTNPATGEKLMSKSLGTGVSLKDSPANMFGKTMALTDEGITQLFIDCTRLPMDQVEEKKKRLEGGENPRDIKLELAHEIVRMYYGEEEAKTAQENWEKTFSQKEIPDNIPELKPTAYDITTVLLESKLAESKSEARRALEQNGVKINEEVITDPKFETKPSDIIQKGKRYWVKVL